MLLLRKQHLQAFERHHRSRFAQQTVPALKEKFPDDLGNEDDAILTAWVWRTSEYLEPRGICSEHDVQRFCELTLEYPDQLRRQPYPQWVQTLLDDTIRPGEFKVGDLEARLASGDYQ